MQISHKKSAIKNRQRLSFHDLKAQQDQPSRGKSWKRQEKLSRTFKEDAL